jgi:hypothetical protein
VLAGLLSTAQVKQQPVPGFEIISRQSLSADKGGRFGLPTGNNALTVTGETNEGSLLYHVEGKGIQARVPALSQVDVAGSGGRIWVYGDSLYRHSATNAYAYVYSSTGALIRSLGLLGTKPYVAAVADNGSMAFAGNTGKAGQPSYTLSLYDENGNKRWSTGLPVAFPSELFLSDDHQYVAVSMFFPEEYTAKVLVYDGTGRLLYTHRGNSSGIAFLPSRKMVICNGNSWAIYDMSNSFRQLHAGSLPGVTVGRFPVIAHPSADIFFILSLGASAKQVSLQAYDARTGSLLAQGAFEGKGYRQPYRQLETMKDGSIQLRTESEVVTVKMK